jgi:hypothetical protein
MASAPVTNVSVTCPAGAAGTYAVSGTISGLGAGTSFDLLDNGVSVTTVAANGSFAFNMPLANGDAYAVTIGTQPAGETDLHG